MKTLIAILLMMLAITPSLCQQERVPPNVLFIMMDDLSSSLGCYGGQAKTPNIDALAARGIRFDNAQCQFTLCNASRASMLSGLRPSTLGVFKNTTEPPKVLTFPEYFTAHGYWTAGIGKIAHEGWPDTARWDLLQTADQIGDVTEQKWTAKDKQLVDGRIARRVAKLIKKHRGAPFLIAAGFTKPHAPTICPQKYVDLYRQQDIQIATNDGDDGLTDPERQRARLEYYACVSYIDAQIGLILNELDRTGLRESTIIVVTSDHGYLLGEHGIWDKRNLYLPTMEVPLIISGAEGLRGVSSPAIVELLDLFPTLTALCGLPAPSLEGRSLVPLLFDPLQPWSQYALTQTIHNKKTPVETAIRDDRYTYIEREGVGVELYDHLTDPLEIFNQIGNPAYGDVALRLQFGIATLRGINKQPPVEMVH
jgi:iduronate 2-sulfatase